MITLKSEEVTFLLQTLQLPERMRAILENGSLHPRIEISDDTAAELRELCLERYDVYGLDVTYQPTPEGKKLDTLIDKLFVG